jgi:hypothetical protein
VCSAANTKVAAYPKAETMTYHQHVPHEDFIGDLLSSPLPCHQELYTIPSQTPRSCAHSKSQCSLRSRARQRASDALATSLDVAHWTEGFDSERLIAALLDQLVHRSHTLLLKGKSYRVRHSLQQQVALPAAT